MPSKTQNILTAGVQAAVATLIIRQTVFTEDYNLRSVLQDQRHPKRYVAKNIIL